MAVTAARSNRDQGDKIDPARASAALARWRRAVASALGQDPGAALDQPDRRLLMLRVFGATRRLGELCMTHPRAAANALLEGPSAVLAQAARDLAGLDRGVGGPDALYAALAPVKNRADVAIALAELGGAWSVAEATAARVDFAERLAETALQWLVRAAVKRGELAVEDPDNVMHGVYIVAGRDFAHEDLAPYGPLDLIILYDEDAFAGPAARGADRVFVRIGAEFREAFESKPGDFPLFALKTPLGSGVGGAGYADSAARARKAAEDGQAHELKIWLATARIVAGDRTAGGKFLESIEDLVWRPGAAQSQELHKALEKENADPRAVYQRLADHCRLAIGGVRPVFRTASAREVFEIAADSRAITSDAARRLIAGEELAHLAVSRAQTMKGAAAFGVERDDERFALATLCGFSSYDTLMEVLNGARLDALNTLDLITNGSRQERERYEADTDDVPDADKLEDLGFINGESLSAAVDEWARRASADEGEARFSALAPGLMTAFGETQKPNEAVRLFDALVRNAGNDADVFAMVGEGAPQREALIDALGCFPGAVAPLTENKEGACAFFERPGVETPQTGAEWLTRFTPPPVRHDTPLSAFAAWRQGAIARIALSAAAGATSFDAAANALNDIHLRALADIFELARVTAPADEDGAGDNIALHVFDGAGAHLPGAATHLGFIAGAPLSAAGEVFAQRYLTMLGELGEGVFAVTPDVSHRPQGVSGVLAPDLKVFRTYVQSEAVAHDQIMLARGHVIAGDKKIAGKARDALRGAVSGARRADLLFRDLDRARAQRMRRDRANSQWDIDRLEGGRLDVELVISALIYRHAPAHPMVQETDVAGAVEAMARSDLMAEEAARSLIAARAFWMRLQVVRALAQWSDPVRDPVRQRFGKLIARAAGVKSFDQVRPLMLGYADDVSRHYAELVLGRPALNVVQAAG